MIIFTLIFYFLIFNANIFIINLEQHSCVFLKAYLHTYLQFFFFNSPIVMNIVIINWRSLSKWLHPLPSIYSITLWPMLTHFVHIILYYNASIYIYINVHWRTVAPCTMHCRCSIHAGLVQAYYSCLQWQIIVHSVNCSSIIK